MSFPTGSNIYQNRERITIGFNRLVPPSDSALQPAKRPQA